MIKNRYLQGVFALILFGLYFISYQGWHGKSAYHWGWSVIERQNSISSGRDIEDIAKNIANQYGYDTVIIVNWKKMEP